MRRRKDPTRKTVQAEDNSSPEDPHNPGNHHNCQKHRGTAPDKGRCTRYVAVHPLRGAAPEQKRCIAYGSGAVPQHTRTNAELAHRTTHRRTPPCATGPYWRQDGHAAHAATCAPAHSGPLRPNPTPPTPLHAKSRLTPPTAPRRTGSEPIARQAGQPAGFSETSARTRLGPSAVARMPRYWGRHAKQPMVRWSCAGVRLRHVMSMSVGVGLAVVMT